MRLSLLNSLLSASRSVLTYKRPKIQRTDLHLHAAGEAVSDGLACQPPIV